MIKPDSRPERYSSTVPMIALIVWGSFVMVSAAGLAAEPLDRIVLRVNNEIATLYDYDNRKSSEIAFLLSDRRLTADQRKEKLGQIGRQIMQQMFKEMLVRSRAEQLAIRVSDQEVDEAIETIKQQQGITRDSELLQALEASGMTLEELRSNTRRDLVSNQVIGREVTSRIEVSDEELRASYRTHIDQFTSAEERFIKEIIVLDESGLDEEAQEALAEELHERLSSGEDLDEIAAAHKELGHTTGVVDLGWLKEGELEGPLAETAATLKLGEYSQPIRSRGGIHILHLSGLREAKVQPFEDVQEMILGRERQIRFGSELREYLAELERDSFIVEDLPPDAIGYRALVDDLEPTDELELFHDPVLPAEASEDDETDEVVDESSQGGA